MKQLILVALFLICAQASLADTLEGKVIGISDGDTISVLVEQTPIKIRLAGIDCPEKGQDFGERARQMTSRLCFGKQVKIDESGRDKYGRTIGEVKLLSGKSVNRELVRKGYAWVYRQYSNDEKLIALESKAKTTRRGLWKHPHPIAPWVYRRSAAQR